jgi:hypothetical protein
VKLLDPHTFEVRWADARGVDSAYRPILEPGPAAGANGAFARFRPVLLGNSAANG